VKKFFFVVFFSAALALFSQGALRIGIPFRGQISATNTQTYQGHDVVWHNLDLQGGESVFVHAPSDGDGILFFEYPNGKRFQQDDWNSLDPGFILSGVSGRIKVGFAFVGGGEGPYSLLINSLPEAISIDNLETWRGELSTLSIPTFGVPIALARMTATRGQSLDLLASSDFDNMLFVVDSEGNIYEDDDGGDGTNARVRLRNLSPGPVLIAFKGYDEEAVGPFSLTFSPRPEPKELEIGQIHRGKLDGEGVLGLEYFFPMEANTYYQVVLRSSDFDAYLEAQVDGLSYEDDDGAGDSDSLLILSSEQDTQATIEARAFSSGESGLFDLQVNALTFSKNFRGRLSEGSSRDIRGKYYSAYTYEGQGGQELFISLKSQEYDTYLIVQDGSGNLLTENDDLGGGTDSGVFLTLPQEGKIQIISTTFNDDLVSGAYEVRIFTVQ